MNREDFASLLKWDPTNVAARLHALGLDAADQLAREGGLLPMVHAAGIADAWRLAKEEHFKELVRRAKVRQPSPVTLAAFQDALDHRAGR